jgi:hypothetical protein
LVHAAAKAMRDPPSWASPMLAAAFVLGAVAWLGAQSGATPDRRFDGFNVIAAAGHPFGSAAADISLAEAKRLGATAVAIIPFFWQSSPDSPDIVRGEDMDDAELRTAIRDAHAHHLAVLVKPHVWVPQSWAGAVAMRSQADWQMWFANYTTALTRIARVAENEKAEALAIGTELFGTTQRPQWNDLIARTRAAFSGRLLYVAHNIEEAQAVPFWERLDAIGVSLYPPLGADDDGALRRDTMRKVASRLDAVAAMVRKPLIVAEIGLRSAQGAAAKPWESAEERATLPDPTLQADVLRDWLAILDRPTVEGVMVWRWFTDPEAGGLADTDFTVQGKPAERVLMCAWTVSCGRG